MTYSHERLPGREHVPIYPKGFIAVRIVQLVMAVIVIALAAYGLSVFNTVFNDYGYYDIQFPGADLNIFTGVVTLITCVYIIIAEFGPVSLYNYWAIMSLDIFLVILWLSSFAVMAAEVAPYTHGYTSFDYNTDSYVSTGVPPVIACLAASAGIGGIEFLLFILSLAVHSVMMYRHRAAGLHCMPGQARTDPNAPASTQAAAPAMVQQQPVAYQQQPQVYAYTQQQQPQQVYAYAPQQVATPPPGQVYAVPQQTPSPLQAQPTGASYTQPVQQVYQQA